MNNVTYIISKESSFLKYSVNDIKSIFMAEKYVKEILKLYGKKVDNILNNEKLMQLSSFSRIHDDVA